MTNTPYSDRYRREIKLAQKIQGSLLPKTPPAMPGLEIWYSNHPVLGVGGDFYDFIQNPDKSLTFVIGDICGKGMAAAMLMTMVRKVIRMVTAGHPNFSPVEILKQCNEHLFEDLDSTQTFATIFLARYNPAARRLDYVNAGHSPVVYCPKDGEAHLVPADCAPIGALATLQLPASNSLALMPGDLLVLGTDGLIEAYDPLDLEIAHKRLVQFIQYHAARPVPAIAANLLAQLKGYQKAFVTEDDQILCIVKGV